MLNLIFSSGKHLSPFVGTETRFGGDRPHDERYIEDVDALRSSNVKATGTDGGPWRCHLFFALHHDTSRIGRLDDDDDASSQ
jgi:hypothetical protein